MTLKLAQFCDDPKKYPQNLHTPQKYTRFSKPPKILKFRILNPKKLPGPMYVWKCQSPPLSLGTPLTQGLGSKGQNSTFSEHGHFAYQIKGNHEMQQHSSKYFARRPLPSSRHDPRRWGQKVKVQLFQNMAMLHIKFKGITKYTNIVANILDADHPRPLPPRAWANSTLSEHGHMLHHAHNEMYFAHNETHFAHNELN